jgi:hypothetical protein
MSANPKDPFPSGPHPLGMNPTLRADGGRHSATNTVAEEANTRAGEASEPPRGRRRPVHLGLLGRVGVSHRR